MKRWNIDHYERLRKKYRPDKVKLLLIAEAPPLSDSPRFFYDINTKDNDNLYLETMSVLFCGLTRGVRGERSVDFKKELRQNKAAYLQKFKDCGFWLQDAVPVPIGVKPKKDTERLIRNYIDRMIQIIKSYHIDKCILIKDTVYDSLSSPLEAVGVKILNHKALKFPASRWQTTFRKEFGELLQRNGYVLPLDC